MPQQVFACLRYFSYPGWIELRDDGDILSAELLEIIGLVFLGVGVGLISSFLGLGGGVITVPLLPLVTGCDVKQAIATSLIVIAITSARNTYAYAKKKMVDVTLVFQLAIPALVISSAAAFFTASMDIEVLRWTVLAVFLGILVISLLGPQRIPNFLIKNDPFRKVAVGSIVGAVSGFAGVGGGTIFIPIMTVGQWTPNHQVAPTGNAVSLLTTATAFLMLIGMSVDIRIQDIVIISVAGILVSEWVRPKQHLLSAQMRLRWVLLFMLIVFSRLLWQALQGL